MRAQVYIRRRLGQRIPRPETSQPSVFGELQFSHVSYANTTVSVLELHAAGTTSSDRNIARLFEPVMTNLGSWWICFRGYESMSADGGPIGYVQEWRCYISSTETKGRA